MAALLFFQDLVRSRSKRNVSDRPTVRRKGSGATRGLLAQRTYRRLSASASAQRDDMSQNRALVVRF